MLCLHMWKLRGRKAKSQQANQLHPGQLFVSKEKRRAVLGGILTYDTLQSRRALCQLSYQGNSAGRGSNLQHNTTQGKSCTTNELQFHLLTTAKEGGWEAREGGDGLSAATGPAPAESVGRCGPKECPVSVLQAGPVQEGRQVQVLPRSDSRGKVREEEYVCGQERSGGR